MSTPSQLATGGQLHEENQRLKRAVEELSVLNDLATAIGGSLNSRDIIQTIIHRSLKALRAEQGVITLIDERPDSGLKTLVRTVDGSTGDYHLHQQLAGWMQLERAPLTLIDPSTDKRFRGISWDPSIRSLICVPMMAKSNLRGVLTLYNKQNAEGFTAEDQRLLTIIASQSAQVLENARLHETEQDLLRMKEELRLAAQIQRDLVPITAPAVDNYRIAGASVPAQVVGGDYYDYFAVGTEGIGLCLGDVSGKGLPASLLMANVQATIRGQALFEEPPGRCLERANRLLSRSTATDKFVTLFFAVLDPHRHLLSYANAGHEPPFFIAADGTIRRLTQGGVVLSILEEWHYNDEQVEVRPGDTLVVYSDGLSEATNSEGTQFGEGRLADLLLEHRSVPAERLQQIVFDAVQQWSGKETREDDRTILVVQRC